MPNADVILALDIGTSSSRAVLYNADTGDALPGALVFDEHAPRVSPDGGAVLDADEIVDEAVRCAAGALEAGGNRRVVAVAVCTFWHSFVGIDAHGWALTPILLWSDRRSRTQVEALRDEMGDIAAYTQRTGCPLHTSFLPGRLRWLSETEPALWARCARFVSPGEYLFAQLFGPGKATCSTSMASGTGLFDQARHAWDAATLAHLTGLTLDRLSPVGDAPVSGLRAPFRQRLPLLADVPWYPALGDGACSNVGCGATDAGRLALMIGTSGALRCLFSASAPPPVPAGLWRYQASAHRFLVGGALSNGGNVWAWLQQTLRLGRPPGDDGDADLGALPPDGHGLSVLPFLHGERAPLWRDDLRGAIIGLGAATTPLEIARAHLEAVAYRFATIRERLGAVTSATVEIIGSGGGLDASPAWTQILADVLGEPILVSREEQASSRGAALLARERLGRGTAEAAPPAIERRVAPDLTRAETYRAARVRHEAWAKRLID